MDSFFIVITNYGNYFLWFIAVFLVVYDSLKNHDIRYTIYGIRTPKSGLLLSLAVLLRTFVLYSLRYFYPKQRPFEVGDAIPLVLENPGGSFPSGHASMAFVLASFIFWKNKPLGVAAFILASLVAYSRVYVGVHYPVDVIVGAVVGVLSFLVTFKVIIKKV